MGQIFGKTGGVAEPAFDVLYQRTTDFTYEIRKYGTRFAAHTTYTNGTDQPFRMLAQYIGVFGTPANEGQKAISMTTPVIIDEASGKGKPIAIAMTAPVVVQPQESNKDGNTAEKSMEFLLPAEYDSMDKIPRPTNPAVTIRELPPTIGAVHRYSGSMERDVAATMAQSLAQQLQHDGLDVSTEYVMQQYQYWGYNPPFTLPMFRRNEVWIALDENQVERLVQTTAGASALPKN